MGRWERGWAKEGKREGDKQLVTLSLPTALVSVFHFSSLQSIPSASPLHLCTEEEEEEEEGRKEREIGCQKIPPCLTCNRVQLHHRIWRGEVKQWMTLWGSIPDHPPCPVLIPRTGTRCGP